MTSRRRCAALGVLVAVGTLWSACAEPGDVTLQIVHAPARVARKAMPLTANVIGRVTDGTAVRHRVNGGPWHDVVPAPPRDPAGWFTVELEPEWLRTDAPNVVEVTAGGATARAEFRYDPAVPTLPLHIDWRSRTTADLEVQDGSWELIAVDGTVRARPVPGTEGYDRILLLSGAFHGGRRVTCDVVLRAPVEKGRLWGCGVLPYWAGHPEPDDVRPRRGWSFALSWYYSKYDALGLEFSTKLGGAAMDWVATYRNARVEADRPWRCKVEAFAEREADGTVLRHRMRTRWWPVDGVEPHDWLELQDRPGAPLAEDDFAVAFVAHRCQVEVGAVTIEAIPDVTVQ